jgi:hypothetical protein
MPQLISTVAQSTSFKEDGNFSAAISGACHRIFGDDLELKL